MKNIAKLREKRIFVLSTFGHSGIDWINSLLDNHNQILIIPSLSYFRKLNLIKTRYKDFDNYNDEKKVEIFCNILFEQSQKKSLRYKLRIPNKTQFKNYIYSNVKLMTDTKHFEEKLFYSLHLGFAKIYNLKINNLKVIICHEHTPWHCKEYLKYFDAKMLAVIRDPRAALAGSFRSFERSKILSLTLRYENTFSFLFHSIKNYKSHFSGITYLIKNEKFNKNLIKEMRKLSKWLGIKYSQTLTNQTFLGKPWYGESAYKSSNDLTKSTEKNYYLIKNVQKRWIEYLNENEIKLIEIIFDEIFKIGKYKKKFNLSIQNKFLLYLKFLTNNSFFNNKYQSLKSNYFKLIIKKFLLIIFKDKYTNIFKLA